MSDCLARLQIDHAWYSNRRSHEISLLPDPQTEVIFRRFDLWWRYDAGEWTLYSSRAGTAGALLSGLDRALDGGPLRLRVAGDLAHLASVTALPEGARTLPHFTTRAFDIGAGEDAADRILRAISDETAPPATIWLYPSDLAGTSPNTTWRIRFEAARLPWIYYVVNRSRSPLNQPFMRSSEGHVLAGPIEARLPDGDDALRFDTGTQAWTFSQTPAVRMGLFDRFRSPLSDQTTEICLIRSVPLPSPGAMVWDGDGAGQRVGAATTIYL